MNRNSMKRSELLDILQAAIFRWEMAKQKYEHGEADENKLKTSRHAVDVAVDELRRLDGGY
jgi:hypothetical protein